MARGQVTRLGTAAAALAALAALAAGGCSRRALRSMSSVAGLATLTYDARYEHLDEGDAGPTPAGARRPDGVATVGLSSRGALHRRRGWLGYALGLDLRLGGASPAAFAYEANLYLLGAAARLGDWGHLGVVQGVGFSGVTGQLGFAGQLPLEAFFEANLGGRLRLLTWVGDRYLFGEAARDGGADSRAPFGDELTAGAGLRWSKRGAIHGNPYGGGYFLGAVYREQLGARYLGVTIGYHLDATFGR